jgi:hypothetical protein
LIRTILYECGVELWFRRVENFIQDVVLVAQGIRKETPATDIVMFPQGVT